MEFTPITLADKRFFNYIFLGILADKKPVVSMFDTRGNTLIPENLAKDLDLKYIDDKPIDEEEVVYESKFTFKIDEEEVKLPTTQVEKELNDKDIQVVFGADFLRLTSWSLYNPMGYVRARN